MTEEQQIEEVLMEAEAYGIREVVISHASELREINIHLTRVDSFELAFQLLKPEDNE
jgi:hypothetical protein